VILKKKQETEGVGVLGNGETRRTTRVRQLTIKGMRRGQRRELAEYGGDGGWNES